ncbi:MAG: hypothetical protein ABI036_12785 [Fibrobacteria bacterium]
MNSPANTGSGPGKSLYANLYRDPAQPVSQTGEEDGKFVLLTKGKGVHLVLSPVSLTPYHANIVYQYLQVEGRGEVEAVSSSGCRILSKGWKVHGGGYFTLQHWLHHLVFHGKSTAFGKYDQKLLGSVADGIAEKLGLEAFTLEFK